MALVVKDRVRETSTTTGTGTFTLAGAVTGYQAFSAVGDGNTTYYTIYLQGGNEWEVGVGTYTASGTTLSRDTILASSNAGSAVNFSAGTKDVFVTYPAGRSVWYDSATNVTLNALTLSGGTANGVPYLSSPGKVLTTGSALTFDGTNFALTGKFSVSQNSVGLAAEFTNADATNGYGVSIAAGGTSATRYALVVRNPASTQDYFKISTVTGEVGHSIFAPGAPGSSEIARFTTTGLGIGTNNPTTKLEVKNNSATAYNPATAAFNTILTLTNTTSGASTNATLAFFTESNGEWYIGGVQNSANTAADFVWTARASGVRSEKMRLDSSGNLGIGTTSPTAKLQVAWSLDQLKFTVPSAGFKQIGSSYTGYVSGNDYSAIILGTDGSAGGKIQFSTMPSGGALTTAATIDQYGNLGLGVTPSVWNTGYKAFVAGGTNANNQVGGIASGSGITIVSTNYYRSTAPSDLYAGDGFAMKYTQSSGQHIWETAASGTAGNAITFTQVMTLLANGNLGVGETNPAARLDVRNGVAGEFVAINALNTLYDSVTAASSTIRLGITNSAGVSYATIKAAETGVDDWPSLTFGVQNIVTTNPAERMKIDPSGTLILRQSSNAANTSVSFNTTVQNALTLDSSGNLTLGGAAAGTNRIFNINGVVNKASRIAFQESGVDRWLIGNGAASENGNFEIYDATNANNFILTRSGNLGLGVTPSAWRTSEYKAVQVGNGASFYGRVTAGDEDKAGFSANAFFDQTDNRWEYIATDSASRYDQIGGGHYWFIAPSGTANTAITFTQAMTLDASGNLGIGQTNPSTWLVNGLGIGSGANDWGATIYTGTASTGYLCFADGATGLDRYRGYISYAHATNAMIFATDATERARITSSGTAVFTVARTSSTNATSITLSDTVTGVQTNGVYKAIRSESNNGAAVSEIRFLETSGTNNDTAIAFATANVAGGLSEKMRVLNTGAILALSGASLTATGTGIAFPSTQSASSDANTLDDYEEGTFDPEVTFGGGSTGLTYTSKAGFYRKIGSLVFFSFRIILSAKGSSTGLAKISIPFPAANISRPGGANLMYGTNFTTVTAAETTIDADQNTSVAALYSIAAGVSLTDANFQNTTDFIAAFCYISA